MIFKISAVKVEYQNQPVGQQADVEMAGPRGGDR